MNTSAYSSDALALGTPPATINHLQFLRNTAHVDSQLRAGLIVGPVKSCFLRVIFPF